MNRAFTTEIRDVGSNPSRGKSMYATLEALEAIAREGWKRTRDPYWKARLKWIKGAKMSCTTRKP